MLGDCDKNNVKKYSLIFCEDVNTVSTLLAYWNNVTTIINIGDLLKSNKQIK